MGRRAPRGFRAGRPAYLDPDQQQPSAERIAEKAIEHYFSFHPPQHREETDGHLAAARAAASALPAEVDLETTTSAGLFIAENTGVDPSAVMSMIGQHRASSRSEAPLLELPTPEPDATTTDVEPEPETVELEALVAEPDPEGRSRSRPTSTTGSHRRNPTWRVRLLVRSNLPARHNRCRAGAPASSARWAMTSWPSRP